MQVGQLLFISNELLDSDLQKRLLLPLTFISFAIVEGKMYTNVGNYGTLNIPPTKRYGGDVIYGAIYSLRDFDFNIRTLDAYHLCSLSSLRRNHILDTQHRIQVSATPIYFDTIEQLETLRYEEGDAIQVQAYFGNQAHPKIIRRIRNTRTQRIKDSIYVEPYLKLLREENYE